MKVQTQTVHIATAIISCGQNKTKATETNETDEE